MIVPAETELLRSANARRSTIKHGWLETGVLGPVRERREFWFRKRQQGQRPEFFTTFDGDLAALRLFLREAWIYDLGTLADWGPFVSLPSRTRQALRIALGRISLRASRLPQLSQRLSDSCDRLEAAFNDCVASWDSSVHEERAQEALTELESAAVETLALLERWPRGFELP